MSDPGDWAYDALQDEMFEEIANQAIKEDQEEQFRSFFFSHQNLVLPAIKAHNTAIELLENDFYTPAYIQFMIAIELYIKEGLLKPLICGLVKNDEVSELLADVFIRQNGILQNKKSLLLIGSSVNCFDINSIQGSAQGKLLIDELPTAQKTRNKIIHRGETVIKEDLNIPEHAATAIKESILEPLFNDYGLTIHDSGLLTEKNPGFFSELPIPD